VLFVGGDFLTVCFIVGAGIACFVRMFSHIVCSLFLDLHPRVRNPNLSPLFSLSLSMLPVSVALLLLFYY